MNEFAFFFPEPDIQQIFLHDMTTLPNYSAVAAHISGFELWAERALLLARRGDVVCVSHPVEDSYLRFLRTHGFGILPEDIVSEPHRGAHVSSRNLTGRLLADTQALNKLVGRIDRRKRILLNVYILTEDEYELAGVIERKTGKKITVLGGRPDYVSRMYPKEFILREARNRGIPVSHGEIVALDTRGSDRDVEVRRIAAAIERRIGVTGRVIVRGSISTSGSAVYLFDTCDPVAVEKVLRDPLRAYENRVYLVDPYFEPAVSPNILTYISPWTDSVTLICASDQRLDEAFTHTGNSMPSKAEKLSSMIRDSMTLSRCLGDNGYSGFGGFDFVEYREKRTKEIRYFLTELNPRVNGSLFPRAVQVYVRAAESDATAFLSENLCTTARCFAELEACCGDLFFDPLKKRGVFPYNTGTLRPYGYFSAVFLGDGSEEVERIAREFRSRL